MVDWVIFMTKALEQTAVFMETVSARKSVYNSISNKTYIFLASSLRISMLNKYCLLRVFPPKQWSLCSLETPMSLDISGSSMKPGNLTVDGLWRQISRFLASKGHQKPWYRLRSVKDFTSVRDDSRYLCHFSIRLFVHYTILKSSLCKLIWRHWTYKMPVRYILASVWVRLSIFSQLSIIQYMGLYVFSLHNSLVMIERIYTYYHNQIGSMDYPLFRVR